MFYFWFMLMTMSHCFQSESLMSGWIVKPKQNIAISLINVILQSPQKPIFGFKIQKCNSVATKRKSVISRVEYISSLVDLSRKFLFLWDERRKRNKKKFQIDVQKNGMNESEAVFNTHRYRARDVKCREKWKVKKVIPQKMASFINNKIEFAPMMNELQKIKYVKKKKRFFFQIICECSSHHLNWLIQPEWVLHYEHWL